MGTNPYKVVNIIHEGDCLELLRKFPSDFLDCTITSPPYNKCGARGGIKDSIIYDEDTDSKPESEYQSEQIDVLEEIHRATVPGGHCFYNHKVRYKNKGSAISPFEWLLKTSWLIRQEIVWDRNAAINIRGWRFHEFDERIYWLNKSDDAAGHELESKHAILGSVWHIPPETKNKHPAPFPIELPARVLISVFNNEKEKIVFDPYMGSGTTAVAAVLLGHHYIGLEQSPKYIKTAEKRIKEAQSESFKVYAEQTLHNVKNPYHRKIKPDAEKWLQQP